LIIMIYAFFICAGLVAYCYLAYPILIHVLSRRFGRDSGPPAAETLPAVTILIAAHDEEAVIGDRVRDALATDYPAGLLDVVVASDGSKDATAAIVRGFDTDRVRFLEFTERRGKAAVLNDAIPQALGEIVLLSDANTRIETTAARRLVRWFADPGVGVVCGRLVLTDPASGRNVDGLYWKYETFLKRCEGRLGALLGSNGAIYAIRKDRFVPIPRGTIVDDLVIPLLAKLETGCAIIYDGDAVAIEETPPGLDAEFRRRARIGAGGFQSLPLLWRLLDPRRGWIALAFLSHKLLRWTCPFFLIGLLGSSLALSNRPLFRACLAAQLAFYLLSSIVALAPSRVRFPKLLRVPAMFTGMNLALLVGFWRWTSGPQLGTWERTARTAEAGKAAP
jgi:cellulose synthase/poly-beta-1,6-N-acetylglucosamine synthase-like glycosyltransferase